MKAFLILEDGTVFEGTHIGASKEIISEIVFNTSMAGYLEILTALVNKNWTLKLYFFTYNLPLLYSRICFPVLPGCKISQRICRPFFVEKFYICSHFFLNIFSPQVKISK